jgi:hypothetical protein
MESKGNNSESENGAENQVSDRTDLYNAIRNRADISCAAYLLRVNSQNEAASPPVADPYQVEEEEINVRKAPRRGGSQLRGGGDDYNDEQALISPDERSKQRPEKGVRKIIVGDGGIYKIKCVWRYLYQ